MNREKLEKLSEWLLVIGMAWMFAPFSVLFLDEVFGPKLDPNLIEWQYRIFVLGGIAAVIGFLLDFFLRRSEK